MNVSKFIIVAAVIFITLTLTLLPIPFILVILSSILTWTAWGLLASILAGSALTLLTEKIDWKRKR